MPNFFLACFFLTGPLPAMARIDTAVLTPTRRIQTYIYNSADLTMIKDTRVLHFAKGMNPVRFSWAGTRIDPTSLSLDISDPDLPLEIRQIRFPTQGKIRLSGISMQKALAKQKW